MAKKREGSGPRGDSAPLQSNITCGVTACAKEWKAESRISWGSWPLSSNRELSTESIKKSRLLSTEHYAFPRDPKHLSQAQLTSHLLGAQS